LTETASESNVVRIVPLTTDDIDALIELAGVIWRHHYAELIGMQQVEYMLAQRYTPANVRGQLQRDDAWWDKVLAGGRMIGFAQYELSELSERKQHTAVLKLNQIYLHQDFQRRGHGGRILEHVAEQARLRGCDRVRLSVNRHNVKSIAAYRKHGFAVAATLVTDIGGGFVMDDYVMEKKL